MNTTTRKPTPADIPAVARIVFDAFGAIGRQHNFPLDFPNIELAEGLMSEWINHPKVFGVLAESDGKIVGCNFIEQRNPIGGVGPICIDPALQGKGIGRKLMHAVVDVGQTSRGIRLVQDAFNTASLSLYTSVGFDPREPLALMRGRCRSARGSASEVRPMTEGDVPACAALCERVHGHDRGGELVDAIHSLRPQVLERKGRIVAYASSPWLWFLSHGVAESEQDMRDLLVEMSAVSSDPIELLVPTRQAWLFRWLLAEGVKMVKPMTLMTMGFYQEPRAAWWPSVLY